MSYILDALRRADAERARGAVPGLHDQAALADGEPGARNYAPLIWAASAAGVLVVAGLVLLWAPWRAVPPSGGPVALGTLAQATPQGADKLPPAAQGQTPPAQPAGLAPTALPGAPPSDGGPANNGPAGNGVGNAGGPPSGMPPGAYPPPPGAAPTFANGAPPGFPSAASAPPRMAAAGPGAASGPVEHYGPPIAAPQQPVQQAPAATAAPARTTAANAANAVPNINDLPANVRAQLPRLVVGGAIYSESPSARMVILNGQVWHEGEKPATDTVLELIRLKSAVLNFRGQRYEINY